MPLSDYKLPALGALQDYPPAGDLEFFKHTDLQCEGLLKMINERRFPVALTRRNRIKAFSTTGGKMSFSTAPGFFAGYRTVNWDGTVPPDVSALADAGYVFVAWSGDVSGTSSPVTPPSQEWAVVVANFKKIGDPDPPLLDYIPVQASAAFVQDLRGDVEDTLTHYINTDVHPGGSLQGFDTITSWDIGTCLASAGVPTSPDNWTRVPAGDPFGQVASTGVLSINSGPSFRRTQIYKQHFNEIIQVCQKLTHIRYDDPALFYANPVFVAGITGSGSLTEDRSGFAADVDCDAAKAAASAAWDAASWADSGSIPRITGSSSFDGGTTYTAELLNSRGKIYADLTGITGAFSIYGKFVNTGTAVAYEGFTGTSPATWQLVGTDGGGGLFASITLGETKPTFPSGCPLGGESQGWQDGFPAYVWEPVFSLT